MAPWIRGNPTWAKPTVGVLTYITWRERELRRRTQAREPVLAQDPVVWDIAPRRMPLRVYHATPMEPRQPMPWIYDVEGTCLLLEAIFNPEQAAKKLRAGIERRGHG